jgi:hypothetical protein
MSARKIESASSFQQNVTVDARQARLSLSPDSVVIHRNGIEFRSPTPFSPWTEMTLTLKSPGGNGRVHCSGVVIACTGSRHAGYDVSMVFTGVSKHAQARLDTLAYSQPR